MKNIFTVAILSIICITLSGCELIEGVFKAGMGAGILITLFILTLLALIFKLFKK